MEMRVYDITKAKDPKQSMLVYVGEVEGQKADYFMLAVEEFNDATDYDMPPSEIEEVWYDLYKNGIALYGNLRFECADWARY